VDVTLSATDDIDPTPTIYFTTDGTTPTTASPLYTILITITADTTLNFMAVDAAGNTSPVSTEDYVITISDVTPPVVSASPTSGTFTSSVDVTLSATDAVDPSPTIHYTTDGSAPTTASPVYAGLITITADTTLNFMAVDAAGNTSPVSTEDYVITTPSIVTLTIEAIDNNGVTRSMWNGIILDGTTLGTGFAPASYLVTTGVEYTAFVGEFGPYVFDHWEDASTDSSRLITIIEDTTITAFMLDTSLSDVTPPVVSASPTSGTFVSSVDVTLTATDAVDPAPTIYYTTDGSTPTIANPVYTAPITITADTTLNFIATDSSGNTSPVSTESYVITTPTTDVVEITKAEYRISNGDLRVQATSTDPSATLTVVGYGEMKNKGDGDYQFKARGVADPGETITVITSSGGSATSPVKHRS